jgi:hypothetical protein
MALEDAGGRTLSDHGGAVVDDDMMIIYVFLK